MQVRTGQGSSAWATATATDVSERQKGFLGHCLGVASHPDGPPGGFGDHPALGRTQAY